MLKCALALALAALAAPFAASASPTAFAAHASLTPTGCVTSINGNAVSLSGCVAHGAFAGTSKGTIELRYTAKANIAKGGGSQRGTVTLHGAGAQDLLVLKFAGKVTITTGIASGTWTAVTRKGAFAKLAPGSGTYASHTPDQGVHLSFDVRG